MPDLISKELLRAYLLGTLDEPQKEIIEHAYLTDAKENERLSAAEEDLIEDYLDGNLDPTERKNFELFFLLSPERCQNVAITRALRRTVRQQPQEYATQSHKDLGFHRFGAPRVMIWAALGLFLVFTTVSVSLYLKNRDLHSELASLEQEHSRLKGSLQSSVGGQQDSMSGPIELRPGLTRDIGDSVPQIRVPEPAAAVKFVLQVTDPNYASYYVVLRSAEGDELLSEARLPLSVSAGESVVSLWVTASALQPGDYQFVLWGIQGNRNRQRSRIGFYNFRVVKR